MVTKKITEQHQCEVCESVFDDYDTAQLHEQRCKHKESCEHKNTKVYYDAECYTLLLVCSECYTDLGSVEFCLDTEFQQQLREVYYRKVKEEKR